jgi:signal transduction histidine kinase
MRTDGPAYAAVFGSEILQILSNFIINSFDAVPETGGTICLRVTSREKWVHLTVADNGCGMDEAIYEKIFEPHNTSKAHGTGLGLWLSHGIAQKHGGGITCRSSTRAGRSGTTFRLSLPASRGVAKD